MMGAMSDSTQSAAPIPFTPPTEFFAALSNPIRIWVVQRLASGAELTPTEVAAAWKQGFDSINVHMKVLAKAGVVSTRRGEDRRSTVYFMPEAIRREAGFLDYGWCRFRIA